MSGCICCTPIQVSIKPIPIGLRHGRILKNQFRSRNTCSVGVRASMVDSTESSSNFAKRMERAWLISQVRFGARVFHFNFLFGMMKRMVEGEDGRKR